MEIFSVNYQTPKTFPSLYSSISEQEIFKALKKLKNEKAVRKDFMKWNVKIIILYYYNQTYFLTI